MAGVEVRQARVVGKSGRKMIDVRSEKKRSKITPDRAITCPAGYAPPDRLTDGADLARTPVSAPTSTLRVSSEEDTPSGRTAPAQFSRTLPCINCSCTPRSPNLLSS